MRSKLREIYDEGGPSDRLGHVGLAYGSWAPIDEVNGSGKVPDAERLPWLKAICARGLPDGYVDALRRWQASFTASGDRLLVVTSASRLLIGHGNASPTEIGLTVHHTWGVPCLPGSALKGLAAHYVDAVFGPDDPEKLPWDLAENSPEAERAKFQGVIWDAQGMRIQRGPGVHYRALFGAPDADDDETMKYHHLGYGAERGGVIFHDALLFVPPGANPNRVRLFEPDVLTPHQSTYYRAQGKQTSAGTESWPNDWDDPIPVHFLTVKPRTQFLLALSGPPEWTALAEKILCQALQEWGVGGKASSGYGLFTTDAREPASPLIGDLRTWLEDPTLGTGIDRSKRNILRAMIEKFGPHLAAMSDTDWVEAKAIILKTFNAKNIVAERDAFLAAIRTP